MNYFSYAFILIYLAGVLLFEQQKIVLLLNYFKYSFILFFILSKSSTNESTDIYVFLTIIILFLFIEFLKNHKIKFDDLYLFVVVIFITPTFVNPENMILVNISLLFVTAVDVLLLMIPKLSHRNRYPKNIAALSLISFVILITLVHGIKISSGFEISEFGSPLLVYSVLFSVSLLITNLILLCKRNYNYIISAPLLFVLLDLLLKQDYLKESFIMGVIFAFLVVVISYKMKFLTISGCMATFVLAGFLFGFGGVQWSVPILTFFILSSILSKVRKKINYDVESFFEKSGVRDHWQVAANGGLGGVLVICYAYTGNELFYLLNIVSLAAVCADTWATEIGTFKRAYTYNILTFKPIDQGRSGGVSLQGTFGSIAGATVIALSGVLWVEYSITLYFLIVVFGGLIGSIIDSIMGATIQLQLQCNVCNKITEKSIHCSHKTIYFSGYKFIGNDLVNFTSALCALLLIIIFQNILQIL